MMTPKDWRFVLRLVEHTATEAYGLGREDEKTGKTRDSGYFKAKGPAELAIKKMHSEFIENP